MRRVVIISVLFALLAVPQRVFAGGPPGSRAELVQIERTAYVWVVGAWNFETCRILTDDLSVVPQYEDVSALCGPSSTSLIDSGSASIYYLGEYDYREDVWQPLPEIEITTHVAGDQIIVQAVDPLSDQQINKVDATINGSPAVCDEWTGAEIPGGLRCEFSFHNPPVLFEVFATSTNGDRSKIYRLRIDNIGDPDSIFLDSKNQYVVIGDNAYTQYNPFHDIPGRWGTVPGNRIVPNWIKQVPNESLQTDHSYHYLAGQILLETPLRGQNCPNMGRLGDYATTCGVLSVFDDVVEYQNAYNGEISIASAETGVPNQLIKRIVAVESQFYPGALGIAGETGLYQFTRDGSDTALRWNGEFYLEVCGQYWDYCGSIGYDNLEDWQRSVLQNHLLNDPNNLRILTHALKGNAYQIAKILSEYGKIETPGDVLSYEDLWKITVLNYHAGPSLTSAIIYNVREKDMEISWENLASELEVLQPSALRYVNRVVNGF